MSTWKASEKPRKSVSVSKAKRLEQDRERVEIRETHRRLKVEAVSRLREKGWNI